MQVLGRQTGLACDALENEAALLHSIPLVAELDLSWLGRMGVVQVGSMLRILFFSHGWAGAAHEDFPLTVINSVGYSNGMMLSTITIHAAGNTTEITDVPKQDGQRFADAARQALTAAQAPQAQSAVPPAFVPQAPPPGWYDDGQGAMRWWDGQEWTDHVHPPG